MHTATIEFRFILGGLGKKLVQRTLIIFVKEQIVDRLDGGFITGYQSSDIFTEMLDLVIVGKNLPELR